MQNLLQSVKQLTGRQKLIVGIVLAVVVATWLAVCLILTSYWIP